MTKFKAGDRVRDKSGHHKAWKIPEPPEGVIVGRDKGNNNKWQVDWGCLMGSINWGDEELELVEPALPVRKVTRTEVVPGTYGRIDVLETDIAACVGVRFDYSEPFAACTAAELRAAAAVFLSLAEALEEQS